MGVIICKRRLGVLLILLFSLSCSKTEQPRNFGRKNDPPIANAGPDISVFLPEQYKVELDATKSYDPDGTGKEPVISWRRLSGDPGSVVDIRRQKAIWEMLVFSPGSHSFEVSIKDEQGEIAKDTMVLKVAISPACAMNQRMTTAQFSISGFDFTDGFSARTTSKLFYATTGEYLEKDPAGMLVYDLESKVWEWYELSMGRTMVAVTANDRLALFAGGYRETDNRVTDRVDIFDQLTRTFDVSKVSVARKEMASAVVGPKFIFAGGIETGNKYSDVVDIYDMNTKLWSAAKLSEPRKRISTIVSGSKVYFSGGESAFNGNPSDKIDIYDQATGQWSVSKMSIPRSNVQSVIVGNNIVYLGGFANDSRVRNEESKAEFFNIATQSSTVQCILVKSTRYASYGNNVQVASTGDNSFYYLSDYMISRYDADKNTWTRALINFEVEDRYSDYNPPGRLFVYKDEVFLVGSGGGAVKVTL